MTIRLTCTKTPLSNFKLKIIF